MYRDGSGTDREADDDCAFWLRIPQAERAAATWELSVELFDVAQRNAGVNDDDGTQITLGDLRERRLSRAAFRVTRR